MKEALEHIQTVKKKHFRTSKKGQQSPRVYSQVFEQSQYVWKFKEEHKTTSSRKRINSS